MAGGRKNFYGVREGRIRGVYDTWESCKAQVDGCANEFRGFYTREEAEFYVATGETRSSEAGKALFTEWERTRPRSILANTASQVERIETKQETKQETKPQIKREGFDSTQSFFSQVPNFEPDDNANFDDEFGRFASSQNIAPGSQAWNRNRADAVRHEMIYHYSQLADTGDEDDSVKGEIGGDSNLSRKDLALKRKLQVYQNMCREVNLEPLDTIDGCVANLKSVLVNIIDYIDAKRLGNPIKVWAPDEFPAFKKYTLGPKKRISRVEATKGDGLLAPLLQILKPGNAEQTYGKMRLLAAEARGDHAKRATNKSTNQKAESGLASVKEEPSTPTPVTHKRDSEIISIHGTDSDFSSPPRKLGAEIINISPSSPYSSSGESVVGASENHKLGIKRELDDENESQDVSHHEDTLAGGNKRRRIF